MTLKMLVILLICQLALSVPGPDRNANFNVDIHFKDEGSSSNEPASSSNEPASSINGLGKANVDDNSVSAYDAISGILNIKASTPVMFCIKQWASGKFLNSKAVCGGNPSENEEVVIRGKHCGNTDWSFEIHDGSQWGYIVHVKSDKIVIPDHPKEELNYEDGTKLVLRSDRRPWGLFSLDQINNAIQHISGLYIHANNIFPEDGAQVQLWQGTNFNSMFTFVNCSSPKEVVAPYGNACITGDWSLFFSVDNPVVKQSYSVEVMLGYSETLSVRSSFQFGWEVTASARYWFVAMSMTVELRMEIERTSTETWTSETRIKNQIEVMPNESVAVWQKVIIGSQAGHRAVYQTDIYAHTDSAGTYPPQIGYKEYQFSSSGK